MYGIVLWNGKQWVWTHPRCPFIIRYDYYASKQVFKQYFNQYQEPKKNQSSPPSLTDWQLVGGGMRAVTVGNRQIPPEEPDITTWKVVGTFAIPALLLAATFPEIRSTVRPLLGLQ